MSQDENQEQPAQPNQPNQPTPQQPQQEPQRLPPQDPDWFRRNDPTVPEKRPLRKIEEGRE
jgi:hypothetical protein